MSNMPNSHPDELITYPVKATRQVFNVYRFAKFLPIVSYDRAEKLYRCVNDDFGVVFEVNPRIVMGTRTAEFMGEIVSKLPENVFLQINYLGLKNIAPMLKNFRDFHTCRDCSITEKAIETYSRFLYQKTRENATKSMNCYIKNIRVLITARSKDKSVLSNFMHTMRDTMSSNAFSPRRLTPSDLKPIFYELCNGEIDFENIPAYSDKKPFNDQCITKHTITKTHNDSLEIGGKHWIALAPTNYPNEAHIFDFGQKLGDTLSPAMNINQFRDTFIITTTYAKLSKSETGKIANKQYVIDSQAFPRMFTKFWKKKAEAESIKEKLDNRDPALLFDMTIMVSGKDKLSASENATTVESFWNKGGKSAQISLDRIFGVPHVAFLQSLPLGASQEHLEVTDNYWYNFDNEVAQFVPLEADWKGNSPNFLCVSRRGALAGINFFDSPLSKNGYIIATSGAGKSVFLSQMGFWTHAMGARVFFIDIGGSYKKICNTLNGEYIEVKTDDPICFNPFSTILSQGELEESMPFFQDFIYMLGASKNLEESQREEKYVKSHLNEIIRELFVSEGNALEITDIQNALKKTEDARLKSFAQHLSPFCRGGVYAKFFSGPATVNLSNSFCVLELGSVEEQTDIRDAIIFIMLYHISQTVYHTGNTEKVQVIIDEAHKFLGKNPRMDDFIDQAYRRFRKHDSSILMATQGFDDIYNPKTGGLSKAGQTIIANSPWKVFLKQTATSINMLIQSNLFSFSAMEEDVIRSIKTVKGEYSEFFLINPDEQKIPYRLILDRFFYYITTTDAEDRNKIERVVRERGCNIEDAIEFIIEQEKIAEAA